MREILLLFALIALVTGLPVFAHHNPYFYFALDEIVVHTNATVVSYNAANPHGRLVYSMADQAGTIKEWVAELPAINMMRRFGVNGQIVKAGDEISLRGNPGRGDATMLRVTHLFLPNGDVTSFYAPQGSDAPEHLSVSEQSIEVAHPDGH